jgi:hypothetical protein
VFRGVPVTASRIIGIAKKAQSIPVDFSRPTLKRTRDCTVRLVIDGDMRGRNRTGEGGASRFPGRAN